MTKPLILAITEAQASLPRSLVRLGAQVHPIGDLAIIEAQPPKLRRLPDDIKALRLKQFHHQSLEGLMAAKIPLIALAAPTTIHDRTALAATIEQHQRAIKSALARFGRKIQFEVLALIEPQKLTRELADNGELVGLEGMPPEAIAIALKCKLDAHKNQLAARIKPLFNALGEHRTMPANPLSDVLVQAFIMGEPAIEPALDAALEQADQALDGRFDLRCLGPLPACNFCHLELTEISTSQLQEARIRLGLDRPDFDAAAVQAAFRNQVKTVHPDQRDEPATADDAAALSELKQARQHLLGWLAQPSTGTSRQAFVDLTLVTPQEPAETLVKEAA